MPGRASSRARASSRSAPGVEHDLAARQRLREPEQRAAARAGHRQPAGSTPARAAAEGNVCDGAERPRSSGSRASRDQPAGQRGGAGQRHLLAEHRPHRQLVAVDVAGHPPSRAPLRRAGRAPGPRPAPRATACGSESRSSSDRQRWTAAARSRRSSSQSRACDVPVGRPQLHRPGAVRQPRGCAGRRPRRPPPPRARRGGRGRRSAPRRRGEPGRAAAGPARRCARRARATAGRAGSPGVVAKISRTVALNWRTLREAGRERDIADRDLGGLEKHPRGLRPLSTGQREWAGAHDWRPAGGARGARCSPAGAPGPVTPSRSTDAVGDQSHRPSRRGPRASPTRANPARRRAGSACRPGSPPPAPPRRWRRSARSARLGVRAGQLGRQ